MPYEDREQLEKELHRFVNRGADVAGGNFFDLIPLANRKHDELHGEYKRLDKAFELVTANPGDGPRNLAARLSFTAPGDVRGAVEAALRSLAAQPSAAAGMTQKKTAVDALGSECEPEELERLIEDLVASNSPLAKEMLSPSKKVCLVVGLRGSGKTTYCNYLLTVLKDRMRSQGIVWFRADITKLHKVNDHLVGRMNAPDKDALKLAVDVEWYMAVHAIWVVHLKANIDPAFLPFQIDVANAQRAEDQDSTEISSPFEKFLLNNNRDGSDLQTAWKWLQRWAIEHRRLADQSDRDVLSFLVKAAKNSINNSVAVSLFNSILRFIRPPAQALGSPHRVLLLVDGVDNLRCDVLTPENDRVGGRGYRYWYRKYVRQMIALAWHPTAQIAPDNWLITVRDETRIDINNYIVTHAGGGAVTTNDSVDVDHKRPLVADVRDKKVRRAQSHSIADGVAWDSTESGTEQAKPTGWDETLSRFEFATEATLEQLLGQAKEKTVPRWRVGRAEIALRTLFMGNLRSLSRNVVRAYAYADTLCKLMLADRVSTSKEERLAFLTLHRALLLEGSVLAGSHYMSANTDRHARGCWCPNFFELFADEQEWSGMLFMRLLQASPSPNGSIPAPIITAEEVARHLELLGYKSKNIKATLAVAIDYGLFTADDQDWGDDIDQDPPLNRIQLRKTSKGHVLQKRIFEDVAILYLLATGSAFTGISPVSPVPVGAITSPRPGYVHSRATHVSRRFWSSATVTIALLLQHIKARHMLDLPRIRAASGYSPEVLARFTEEIPYDAIVKNMSAALLGSNPSLQETQDVQRILTRGQA